MFATYYDGTGCGNIFYVCYIAMVIPIYSLTGFDSGIIFNIFKEFKNFNSWITRNILIQREKKQKMRKL